RPAMAQNWLLVPSVTAEAAATTNASFTSKDRAQSDLVLDVFPKLAINGRGAHLQVQGDIGVGAVHYVNGSLSDRLLPSGNLDLKSTLVDRLLYLDGSLSATRSVTDPFAGRPEGATAFNTLSTVRTQLSPALIFAPSAYTQFEARDRTTLIKSSGADLAADDSRRYILRHDDLLRFERKPVPLGLTLEATSEKTTYQVENLAALSLITARATVTWAPNPDLVLGLRTGRDHSRFSLNDFTDPLEGVTLNWKPSDRTELNAVAERRFFGKSGQLSFSHRSPFLSVFARLEREPTTSSDSLGVLPPGSDLAAALDDILATRITNPIERARAVQDLIISRGLSPTLTQALEVFSEGAQLQESATLSLVVLGARHTASLTVFASKAVALTHPGEASLALNVRDNKQEGGSLQLGRRLSPQSSVNLFISGSRIVGLGLAADLAAVSKSVRLSFDQQIGTHTTTSAGVRRQLLTSTTQPDAQESSVFGAIQHRF
ncbi:MAG TPA: TIGR03016 family PEP-CTERM system-associated outer membrane protein, partial [Burkholderiaceae bacterium]|nr:TIGR03016 family PEP-CTERM system-associated outer membrane protein [Burkholderiaceae bacterium]